MEGVKATGLQSALLVGAGLLRPDGYFIPLCDRNHPDAICRIAQSGMRVVAVRGRSAQTRCGAKGKNSAREGAVGTRQREWRWKAELFRTDFSEDGCPRERGAILMGCLESVRLGAKPKHNNLIDDLSSRFMSLPCNGISLS